MQHFEIQKKKQWLLSVLQVILFQTRKKIRARHILKELKRKLRNLINNEWQNAHLSSSYGLLTSKTIFSFFPFSFFPLPDKDIQIILILQIMLSPFLQEMPTTTTLSVLSLKP